MSKLNKLFILFLSFLSICLIGTTNTSAIQDLSDLDIGSVDCVNAISKYGRSYDYIIKDYDINIRVKTDNTYDIIETYDVCFSKATSHGIYRDIPKKIKGWRDDGSTYTANAIIKNLSVSGDMYERENNLSYLRLKIGDPDHYVSREKEYHISYTYDYGEDKLEDADEFYFNLIGSNWAKDVIFLNASYNITLPKAFTYDYNSLGFTSGPINRSRTADVSYTVNGRNISGTSNETYPGGTALTIRVVLPEGYYEGARVERYPMLQIAIAVSAVLLLITYVLFALFGKDNKLQKTVQYDPPKELNPLEFGLLAGNSTNSAVMGLVFHLAEKGYLKIESDQKGKHFTISKAKEYDGKDASERTLMEKLFSYSKDGQNVTDRDLQDKFYQSVPKIIAASKYKKIKKDCYDRKSVVLSAVFLTVSILMTIVILILVIVQASIISSAVSGVMSFLSLALSFIAIIISGFIRKKTDYGDDLYTRALSYKDTIKSTNVLSNQGASYFYYNYAYAYAVGLNTAFSKKFKDVITTPPDWYNSPNSFDSIDSFTHATSAISHTTTSSPGGDGSGGGGGGGGSSGGGGGGGGGSGW